MQGIGESSPAKIPGAGLPRQCLKLTHRLLEALCPQQLAFSGATSKRPRPCFSPFPLSAASLYRPVSATKRTPTLCQAMLWVSEICTDASLALRQTCSQLKSVITPSSKNSVSAQLQLQLACAISGRMTQGNSLLRMSTCARLRSESDITFNSLSMTDCVPSGVTGARAELTRRATFSARVFRCCSESCGNAPPALLCL